jgi:hypothetical protein
MVNVKEKNANIIRASARGFCDISVCSDAPLANVNVERLRMRGRNAPFEHKFCGFANNGLIKSRFFKISNLYNLPGIFLSNNPKFLRFLCRLYANRE